MERVIKFRGKTSLWGKWMYGDYYRTVEYDWENPAFNEELHNVGGTTIDPDTLGQYTGATDIDGTEIYEGDIVRVPNGQTCQVVWERYGFKLYDRQYPDRQVSYGFDGCKVVGNIHESYKYGEWAENIL